MSIGDFEGRGGPEKNETISFFGAQFDIVRYSARAMLLNSLCDNLSMEGVVIEF
jgi:hypothetical protein